MRINASQMTVDTQYASFDEMIEIISVGDRPLSQFYYRGTTEVWKPNRTEAPLTLRAKVTVVDPDTRKQYTPTITTVKWYINKKDTDTSQTAESSVPMIVSTGASWYMVNNNTDSSGHNYANISKDLRVRKNVPPQTASNDEAITILAYIQYTDPRTGGALFAMSTVLLSTDLDADGKYDVHILTPKIVEFDPFREVAATPVEPNYAEVYSASAPLSAHMTLKARAYYGEEVLTSGIYFEWYAVDLTLNTPEQKIDTENVSGEVWFPCYVSGQGTDTLVINPMFADNLTIICRMRRTTDQALKPCRDTITFAWKIPDISAEPYTKQGSSVRDSSPDKVFGIIYNAKDYGTLTDAMADIHFRVKWYKRVPNGAYSELGMGREILVSANELKDSTVMSKNIMQETYLLSQYKACIENNSTKALICLDSSHPNTIVCEREM